MEKPAISPYFALFFAVLAISTSAIFVKLSSAPAPVIATYRLLFSALLTLPMVFMAKGTWSEIARLTRKQWMYLIMSGAFLAAHFLLWFDSLNYTSIASSTVLVTLQPLFAFIGGYFLFKERLRGMAITGGFLAVVGSFVIGWGDFQVGGTALYGDFLALIAAIAVTAYWLIGQYLRQGISGISTAAYSFIVYATSSIFLIGHSLFYGHALTGYPTTDWIWFICLAIFPTLLGHSILNWVIKYLSTSTVSVGILFEPIGTCILAFFIFGDIVTVPQLIGGLIILFGIFIFIRYNQVKGVQANEAT
ncbi:DMT family transporter [Brevibacillus daliensis]|uniref:DMT family transporter n=1 Tax=Brevibacillus daliensis TaxID=2892995 RepID=UPI001E59956D|nr:DMT family transporter [Brevibacillus daliensis]